MVSIINSLYIALLYMYVGIPLDVMHDVLEDVLHLDIACLLEELISSNLLSLDMLNKRISNFAYGNDITDLPVPLSSVKFKMGGE